MERERTKVDEAIDLTRSNLVENMFRQYADSVHRLARSIVNDDAIADDVVQEVFLRLHRSPGSFQPERGSAQAYLLASGRGRALDLVRSEVARSRREDRVAADPTDDVIDHVEGAVLHDELHRQLTEAMARLPEREREPLELAYFGGFSHTEVAEILGAALGTVKARIRRGLARLESLLPTTMVQPEP